MEQDQGGESDQLLVQYGLADPEEPQAPAPAL